MSKSFDPRYRVNIEPGMRVMIKEENKSELIPCYVKEIITKDAVNEAGIKVKCDDDKIGRVKYIGTETSFMSPMELILNLEKKLRKLIVDELSEDDPNWWENKIADTIKDEIKDKLSTGKEVREKLQIPEYELIEETFFRHLMEIIMNRSNWKNHFQKIFGDKNSILVKLTELSPYRNLPAHGKELTPHIEKKIQVYYEDIILLIEVHYRNKTKN